MKVDLRSLVEIKSGYSPSTFNLIKSGTIPFVKVEDLNNCAKYQNESREYCEDANRSVPAGSIIFPKRGAAIMNNKVRIAATAICMDTNMMAIIPNGKTQSEFLYYTILYEKLSRIADTSTIPQINNKHIIPYKILLPPLPEQKAIADLLSTWDEAIEKTERLIQAKGKSLKRLLRDLIYWPTIAGKWKQARAGSLFKNRRETKRGDLPLLSITNGEGVIPRENTNRKDTSNDDKSKYLRICPGDIGYNTMRMWQGVSALSSLEGVVSPAYTICIPGEKLCPLFVAYLFKMPFMIHRFYRYSQGLTSDTWNLKYPHFSEVKMPLPSVEVQQQIAETLSAAQQEIDLLKKLAEKIKTQKRGLMLKLLTGEWRVKPEIVNLYKEA